MGLKFCFSTALKYLLPKRKELSSALVSSVSILVVTLVVWLIIVFFSVTSGLEKRWLDKLVALNAPIQITPTEALLKSYDFKIPSQSLKTGYTNPSFDVFLSTLVDPYDPEIDPPLPPNFESEHFESIAKKTHDALKTIPGITQTPFELGIAQLRIRLVRGLSQSFVTQVSFVAPLAPKHPLIEKEISPLRPEDEANLEGLAQLSADVSDSPDTLKHAPYSLQKIRREQNLLQLKKTDQGLILPQDPELGAGILVPKPLRELGTLVGDTGFLSYQLVTPTAVQEMRIPIFIAGFYDPGITPMMGRFLFVPPSIASQINSSLPEQERFSHAGLQVWFQDLSKTESYQLQIVSALKKAGVSKYWKVESFHDYSFARELLNQLKSDKLLFTLIAIIIIVVACSSIISMLILLVHDKKMEIGIMQALGATKKQIASIFAIVGFGMGILSTCIGTFLAYLTMKRIDLIVSFLSSIQGHQAFSETYFGESLPTSLSHEALVFALSTTLIFSFLSALIPSIKATRYNPSEILKGED